MAVKETKVAMGKQILIAPHTAVTIGCQVSRTVATTGADGKTYVKAGTPVGATEDVKLNREAVLDGATGTIQGVILHDTYFEGSELQANATLVIEGTVDYAKLDSDVQSKVTSAKTALDGKIAFVKGRA